MNGMENVRLALTSLRANKMRSLLTLLGVIVGIASVIIVLTLGASLQKQLFSSFDSMGINDVTVQVQKRPDPDQEEDKNKDQPGGPYIPAEPVPVRDQLTADDVDAIRKNFPGSVAAVFISDWGTDMKATKGLESTPEVSVTFNAVGEDHVRGKDVKIAYGRPLQDNDFAQGAAVAMVEHRLVDSLFNGDVNQALGAALSISPEGSTFSVSYTIVGVIEKKEAAWFEGGFQPPAQVYVPYTAADGVQENPTTFQRVSVRLTPGSDVAVVGPQLQSFFDARYADNVEYEVKVSDFKKDFDQIRTVFSAISMGLSAIAGISLLVGGIGVMNIMLVTVTERTREIGIRKALGARRRDIRLQFVTESMIICLLGGILGVLIGGSVGMLGSKLIGQMVFPPIGGVIVALLFSLFIGLFFGYHPANKAAKLNPLDALRYE